jgi:hypothetical protein
LFCGILHAQVLQWGESTQISTSKDKIDELIKTYVDKNYPQKVKQYHQQLKQKKQTKISNVDATTFTYENLMWQDNEDVVNLTFNSLESRIYCRKLRLASRKDWRVPEFSELVKLVDYSTSGPANLEIINYINPNRYWSVTKDTNDKLKFWYVDFLYGQTGTTQKSNRYNLRCVRDISKKAGDY